MTSPLLVFVNENSGSGFALTLLSHIRHDRSIHLVFLPGDAQTWSERHAQILTDPLLHCVSCRSDGTSNWVATLLSQHFGHAVRPAVAMLPFGTGNDIGCVQG
jgi:diacylglycerol kinase family enzyme